MHLLDKNKRLEYLLWGSILLLAAALRLLWLDSVPYGIHVDEVGMAYDSFWLAREGIDRWCISYPVYMLNYGSGQSALYAYLCMILVKITGGINIWLIRLPSVMAGLLTILAGSRILQRIWGKRAAFFGSFLLAVCPYFVMASRLGLDCNLFLGVSTLAIYLLMKAVETKLLRWYGAAGFCFGLCLYTYVLSYLILPLFLLASGIYLWRLKILDGKKALAFCLPLGLLAVPLMLMIAVNQFGWESLHLGPVTIPRMLLYRANEFGFYLTPARIKELFLSLFLHDGEYCSSFPIFGTMFPWSVPLVLIGLFSMIQSCLKQRTKIEMDARVLLLFFLGAQLLISCSIDEIFTYKLNAVFFVLICCIWQGIQTLLEFIRNTSIKKWTGITLAGLYAAGALIFACFYFSGGGNASYAKGWYFQESYEEAWAANLEHFEGKKLYTEPSIGYFLYSTRIPPKEVSDSMQKGNLTFLNIHFYLGSQYRDNAAYIVSNNNTEYQTILTEWGYKKQYQDDHYGVWY